MAGAVCYLCGSISPELLTCEGQWQFFRCRDCGLVFLHPQPSDAYLLEHYQDYLPEDESGINAWQFSMEDVIVKNASLIEERIAPPGKLLDVGCGFGFFLEHMVHRGWQVEGIEISAKGRRYAQAAFGLNISNQPLPRPDWPNGFFDVITLFYVVEHLKDPAAMLEEVHRLLRPGGVLLVRIPHTTPIVRLLGPWAASLKLYHAPWHLFDFSPETLRRMLEKAGFRQPRTTICGYTRPESKGVRAASVAFGALGEVLARLSGDRLLMPGVSKTTLALR